MTFAHGWTIHSAQFEFRHDDGSWLSPLDSTSGYMSRQAASDLAACVHDADTLARHRTLERDALRVAVRFAVEENSMAVADLGRQDLTRWVAWWEAVEKRRKLVGGVVVGGSTYDPDGVLCLTDDEGVIAACVRPDGAVEVLP